MIVGNPPYQPPSEKKGLRNILWDKFVKKSLELLKENGYLCLVHPSGWRGLGNDGKEIKLLFSLLQMNYLEIHNENDGLKVFGAETRYDWYVLQNKLPMVPTIVKGQDGNIISLDVSSIPFVPNGMFEKILNLVAKPGQEKCEVIWDSSYHTQRLELMSRQKKRQV